MYLFLLYNIFIIILIPLTTYIFPQTNLSLQTIPISLPSIHLQFSPSTEQKTTNLDNNINNTKIFIAIHTPHTHDSRTTKNCQFSSNNKSSSLLTSTHLQPPNTAITRMWDNNIVSKSSPITKIQKIDHTLANRILSNSFQHNTVDSTIILPSVVKNKKSKK